MGDIQFSKIREAYTKLLDLIKEMKEMMFNKDILEGPSYYFFLQ